jgi:hypothetical protein
MPQYSLQAMPNSPTSVGVMVMICSYPGWTEMLMLTGCSEKPCCQSSEDRCSR